MANKKTDATPEVVLTSPEVAPVENKVEETKVEEAPKEEPKKSIADVVAETKSNKEAKSGNTESGFKLGEAVKIKESSKLDVRGFEIPEFAYRNTYRVHKILDDRIVVKAGPRFIVAVTEKDIEKVEVNE